MELSESGRAGFTFCGKVDYVGMPPYLSTGTIVVMDGSNIGILFPVAPEHEAGVKGVEMEYSSPLDSFGLEEYAMEPLSYDMHRPIIDFIMDSVEKYVPEVDEDDLVWSAKAGFINLDDGASFRTVILVPPDAIEKLVRSFAAHLLQSAESDGGIYLEVERAE